MTIDNVPDVLIKELHEIYWDPSDDTDKPVRVKETIVRHISSDHELISKEDLAILSRAAQDLIQLRKDAEVDIGWIVESFAVIENKAGGNVFKFIQKIATGKIDVKALLDLERVKRIGEKYAPVTSKKINALSNNQK